MRTVLLGTVFSAVLVIPQGVFAQACGPDTAGQNTVTCNNAAYGSITYTGSDGLTIDFTNPATVVSTTGIFGVLLQDTAGNGNDLTINATNFDTINARRALAISSSGTAGNATINIDGNGTLNSAGSTVAGSFGALIFMQGNTTGNASVTMNSGTITTGGPVSNAGISASTLGTGNTTVVMNNGTIETSGAASPGIFSGVRNMNSTASARAEMNGGSIRTQGWRSGGVVANNLGLGGATAVMTGGTITLTGAPGTSPGGVFAPFLQPSGVTALVGLQLNVGGLSNTSNTSDAVATMTGGQITGSNSQFSSGVNAVNWASGGAFATVTDGIISTSAVSGQGVTANYQGTSLNMNTVQSIVQGQNSVVNSANAVGVLAFHRSVGDAIVRILDVTSVHGGLAGVSARSIGRTFVELTGQNTMVTSNNDAVWVRQGTTGATSTFDIRVRDGVTVIGTAGDGIRVDSMVGNTGVIEIEQDALVEGGAGLGIFEADGDSTIISMGEIRNGIETNGGADTVTLGNTSVTTGLLNTGLGSDTMIVQANADITGVLSAGAGSINGGDDVLEADGFVDVLEIQGGTRNFVGSDLVNWETVNLTNGADTTFSGSPLVTGSDTGTNATTNLAYGLVVQSGAFARFNGNFEVNGNLNNFGTVDLTVDNVVSTRLDITGDYVASSGSSLLIDVFLNDGGLDNIPATDRPISDQLMIAGDASGTTSLFVTNLSGPGDLTDRNQNGVVDNDEGILFAQVQGDSTAGLFTLGAPVTSGAFTYELVSFDPSQSQSGVWDYVLANRFSTASEAYESYPRSVFVIADMPTLHQRVGNRKWTGASETIPAQIFCKNPDTQYRCTLTPEQQAYYEDMDVIEEDGSWIRVYGARQHINPTLSTVSTDYQIDTAGVQLGHDWLFHETDDGSKWIAGLNAEIDTAHVKGTDSNGDGSTNTTAIGFGGTLTYYKPNGFYVDLQARVLNARTDFSASSGSYDGADSTVYSASIEVGKKIPIGDKGWHVVPQAQLVASNARFDSFTDDNGTLVEPDNAKSRRARLGISVGREQSWLHDDGTIRRLEAEVGAHVYKELAGDTRVVVGGTDLFNEDDDVIGEITLGGTYNWKDDQNSVYGEIGVQRSLRNFGSNRRISGTIGFRHRWE